MMAANGETITALERDSAAGEPLAHQAAVARYGLPDLYIGADDVVFFPWFGNIWLKPLRLNVATGQIVGILWAKGAGGVGRHRHRGEVSGFTLEGSWYYKEYDWVSRPGDFVHESPGVIHTFASDNGVKALFFVDGILEFFDDNDNLEGTCDVFDTIAMYESYCTSINAPFNKSIIY